MVKQKAPREGTLVHFLDFLRFSDILALEPPFAQFQWSKGPGDCIQFARQYPELLPAVHNLSWRLEVYRQGGLEGWES